MDRSALEKRMPNRCDLPEYVADAVRAEDTSIALHPIVAYERWIAGLHELWLVQVELSECLNTDTGQQMRVPYLVACDVGHGGTPRAMGMGSVVHFIQNVREEELEKISSRPPSEPAVGSA